MRKGITEKTLSIVFSSKPFLTTLDHALSPDHAFNVSHMNRLSDSRPRRNTDIFLSK